MDIGLHVEYDGKKNTVIAGEYIKEYPIGGMICEYARLHPKELKSLILKNPYFNEVNLEEKGPDALVWFYENLLELYGVVTAGIVVTDFADFIGDYVRATDEECKMLLDNLNADKDINEIKKFILEESGYSEFSVSTVGQAFLAAYSCYAYSFSIFRHTFDMLIADDEQFAPKLVSMYCENVEFQHFDFRIMLYDGGFHSVYTIQSSLSLILFEAAHVIDLQIKIVKCKNCNQFFVPVGRADSVYCGYPAPQNSSKACRDIGAQVTRTKKLKNDVVTQEYRRLYMRLKMALKRHPDCVEFQEKFEQLTNGIKELRKLREEGEKSSDDIIEWLNSIEASL